jgi:hypothetical protein
VIDPETGIDREPFVRNLDDAIAHLVASRRSLEAAGTNVSASSSLSLALITALRGVEASNASVHALAHHVRTRQQ